ncbi:MAG: hypothetical protein ACNA8W_20020 [Bradymonadaceae bacterium]
MKILRFLPVLMMMACSSAPISTQEAPEQRTERLAASPDPVEVAERWFAAALAEPSLFPEARDEHAPEWSAYRLMRVYLDGQDRYVAVFALDGEPARTPALHLILTTEEAGHWKVSSHEWSAPRSLWPRI